MPRLFNKFEDNKSDKEIKYNPQATLAETPYIVKSI
jgi:hypothetical protein